MSNSLDLAKNRGHNLLSVAEEELQSGKITEAQWYEKVQAVITPAYLSAANPRAQSGHSGDEVGWRQARGLIAEGVNRSGTFLDIGCANGHLMETLEDWCRERGHALEMHGLDIAPELAELARKRLPRYAPRIYVGNAFGWLPPKKFTFVRTGLEYVP
ncbi:MAG: class I SAM-dependent methyltransferase, partial [Bdellovibrionota bacterium]